MPATLGSAFLDRQKGALAKASKVPNNRLGDELKALSKLHVGVEWDALGNDKADTADSCRACLSDLETAARGKIKALLDQARTVEAAAARFETDAKADKQFPKEPLLAVAAIAKAAKTYRAEADARIADLRKTLTKRLAALTAQERKAGTTDPAKIAAEAKAVQLVRTRGLDSIRRIKKPAPGAKPVRFMVVQGRTTIATYMGPSIGPTQEKLLKSLIPADAPYKVFKDPKGELAWENKAVTFVSDVLPTGLVKKMQLWLRKILKVNPRLRVRRTSGEAEETDGEDIPDELLPTAELGDADDDLGAPDADDGAAAGAGAPATAPSGQAAYTQRVGALERRLRQALVDKHPESAKLRALIGFASESAVAKDYAGALKALDMLDKLLHAAPAARPAAEPAAPAADATKASAPGKVAPAIVYTQTRLVWVATRSSIQSELKKLEQAIVQNYRGQPVQAEVSQAVRKLDRVLTLFDESLADNLDKALNSADAAEKVRWHDEARAVIARYQKYLDTDPLVKELDGNPFVPIAVQAKLSSTLAALASKIV